MTNEEILAKIANSLAAIELQLQKPHGDTNRLVWTILGALGMLSAAAFGQLYFVERSTNERQNIKIELMQEVIIAVRQDAAIAKLRMDRLEKIDR